MNGTVNQIEQNLYERLSHVESAQAQQGAKLDAIQGSLDRLNKRADQPTNWFALGGFIFAAFSTALAIMALTVNPVAKQADNNTAVLGQRSELVYSSSYRLKNIEEDIDSQWNVLSTLRNDSKNLARDFGKVEGKLSELEGRVNRIDVHGSVVHASKKITGDK